VKHTVTIPIVGSSTVDIDVPLGTPPADVRRLAIAEADACLALHTDGCASTSLEWASFASDEVPRHHQFVYKVEVGRSSDFNGVVEHLLDRIKTLEAATEHVSAQRRISAELDAEEVSVLKSLIEALENRDALAAKETEFLGQRVEKLEEWKQYVNRSSYDTEQRLRAALERVSDLESFARRWSSTMEAVSSLRGEAAARLESAIAEGRATKKGDTK